MTLDLTIDPAGVDAPFEQVRRQIAEGAADGSLAAGHRLPTVRKLAADLGLANNTVAKAYKALESDGVIETHGRRGTLITSRRIGDPTADEAAGVFAAIARRQGLSRDEAVRLVERHWT